MMTQTATRPTAEHRRPRRRWIAAAAGLLAVVVAVGIWLAAGLPPGEAPAGDGPTSALTEEQAVTVASSYFEGWNIGDYETFARHFDDSLRAGVDEAVFEEFRGHAFPLVGGYVGTTAVDLVAAQTDGYVTWRFTTRFEQEDGVEVRLTFPEDGTEISGAHILSDRLGTR